MDKVIAGIDVSKDQLDVHLLPSQTAFSVPRDSIGLDALAERLVVLQPKLVVMEATGGFETIVAAAMAAANLPVAVVNPRRIRAYAQALGRLAKTDLLDAATIAAWVTGSQLSGGWSRSPTLISAGPTMRLAAPMTV